MCLQQTLLFVTVILLKLIIVSFIPKMHVKVCINLKSESINAKILNFHSLSEKDDISKTLIGQRWQFVTSSSSEPSFRNQYQLPFYFPLCFCAKLLQQCKSQREPPKPSSCFLLEIVEIWFWYFELYFKPNSSSQNYSGTIYKEQNQKKLFLRNRCIYLSLYRSS